MERIKAQCENIEKTAPVCIAKISSLSPESGEDLDTNTVVPNTIGTINDVLSRMLIAVGHAKQISIAKPTALFLVPKSSLASLEKQLEIYSTTIGVINGALMNLETWKLSQINLPAIQLMRKDNNREALNLGTQLISIDTATDSLLQTTNQTVSVIESKAFAPIAGTASVFKELLSELQSAKEESLKIRRTAKGNYTSAEKSLSDANQHIERILQVLGKVETSNNEIEKLKAKANSNGNEISTVLEKATSLETQVNSFKEKFDTFDLKLEERNEDFANADIELNTLLTEKNPELRKLLTETTALKEQLEKIKTDSREVLGNATAAGLASMFRSAGDRLSRPLVISHIVFYFSIVAIFISILIVMDALPPIRNYIQLPPLKPPSGSDTGDAILFIFGSVLSRFMIMLPGLLLAGFASKWHRSLQRLSEEYMHKETVAASVPGFKVESGEKFKEAIAAAAFENMLVNPARKFEEPHPADKKDGWLASFIKNPIRDVIRETMDIKKE